MQENSQRVACIADERTAAPLYLPNNDVQGFLHPRYDFTGDLWLGLIGMGLEADLR